MSAFTIPKHKRLTGQARVIEETRRSILEFGKMVQKDRMLLLSIVSGGPAHWRKVAARAFRGFMVDQTLLDGMFEAMVEQAGDDPKGQFEALQRADLVALKMERLKGLAQFITSEAHLDEVLDKWIQGPDEKAAIRMLMLPMIRGRMH
jgi:hypothetical protein